MIFYIEYITGSFLIILQSTFVRTDRWRPSSRRKGGGTYEQFVCSVFKCKKVECNLLIGKKGKPGSSLILIPVLFCFFIDK